VYFLTARLGLQLATVGHSVSLVWPPTGLALAVLLLSGRRLWPAVLVGAFAVNAHDPGVPLLSAVAMGAATRPRRSSASRSSSAAASILSCDEWATCSG
jgi:integral membrane sensor domain MASE1